MKNICFDKLRLYISIKKYFCKLFSSRSKSGKRDQTYFCEKKDFEEKHSDIKNVLYTAYQFQRLYLRKKLVNLQEQSTDVMSQKSVSRRKSSADLHVELMILFHQAKQAGSIVEVREFY